jgi:hypothetical protein
MGADFYFFTDTNLLTAQSAAQAFGPVSPASVVNTDEYRVTSLHTATTNPTAYAACDAIICVQKVTANPALVNIVLKPLAQPALNFAPVKYIIYKGVLANSLIAANGTDVAPAGNNQLTAFLWAEQAKRNASVTPVGTATAPAKALGIDLTANFADTDPIDNLFYRAGVAFQLPVVKGGWSLGQFGATGFGMEVLMEGLNFPHPLSLARELEHRISVPASTTATDAEKFERWHAKEQILGFMDPCAFYGSFFRAGVQAKISGNADFASKSGNALYNDVLAKFLNRNTAYLDIRNEHNFSFNYFNNYGTAIMLGGTTTPVDYYAGNWPLLCLTAVNFAAGNTTRARNAFALQLPVGDNVKPLIYVSQGYRELRTRGKKFPEELTGAERFFDAFVTPVNGYTTTKGASGSNSLTLAVPNVTGQSTTTPVSCYIRIKYLKQEQGATTVPTVIQSANYLDNLVYPLDLRVLPNGNAVIKTSVYEEEVYVNAQNVAGLQCDFIAKVGIARDTSNTSFWVIPTNVRVVEGQASTLVALSGETSDSPESYPNVIASKYPLEKVVKSNLALSTGVVPVAEFASDADAAAQAEFSVPDFRKLLVFMVANDAYDHWKNNITAPLDSRFRTYLGVKNLQALTDTVGVGYTSFELILRGFALDTATGNYSVQETTTDPVDSASNVTVYTPTIDEGPCSITSDTGTSIPCVPVRGSIHLKAKTTGAGTYKWSTTSTKITLTNATAQIVTLTAKSTESAYRGAETVQLVFTPTGGSALAPVTRKVTVISVEFSQSTTQSYGYDDMDNVANKNPHVSVKQLGQTKVLVTIRGGGTADDLEFTSDDLFAALPAAPPQGAGASFDLTINGQDEPNGFANITAKCKGGPACARVVANVVKPAVIVVNVYKELFLTATVAKLYDSAVAASTLARPTFDVTAAATKINKAYQNLVATLTLTDASATCDAIDVRYDLDGDGVLKIEAGKIGTEMDAINAIFVTAGQRVVIVKKILYLFYPSTPYTAGDATLTFKSSYGGELDNIDLNKNYLLGLGVTAQTVKFTSRAANVFTLAAPLTSNHPVTDAVSIPIEGLSGDPIILQEGATEDLQTKVIGHEIGHSLLKLADLNSDKNVMNFEAFWTDYRLNYKDITKHYKTSETESQWQLVTLNPR